MSSSSEVSWGTDLVRATVFGDFDHSVGDSWWHQLVEEDPDAENRQPKQGIYAATIERENSILTLQVQPGRADVLTKSREQAPPVAFFPNIGAFELVVPDFRAAVEKWLPSDSLLRRMAFGAVLYLPCSDKVDAYEKLSDFLPSVQIDPEGSRDILYQINRPKPLSDTNDIEQPFEINRLNKWSVLRLTQGLLNVSAGKPSVYSSPEEIIAIRLELDINTPADLQGRLPAHRNAHIFHELIEFGLDLSRNGDR